MKINRIDIFICGTFPRIDCKVRSFDYIEIDEHHIASVSVYSTKQNNYDRVSSPFNRDHVGEKCHINLVDYNNNISAYILSWDNEKDIEEAKETLLNEVKKYVNELKLKISKLQDLIL